MTTTTYLSGLKHCRCSNTRVVPPVLTCALSMQSAAKRNRFHHVRLQIHCCCFCSLVSGRHTQFACLLQIASTQQNKHATQCGHQQTPRQAVVQCQANNATSTSSLQMIDAQAPKRRCDNHCTVPPLNTTRAPPTWNNVAAECCFMAMLSLCQGIRT